MSYNINDTIREAEKEYNLGGGFFKIKEGDNKVRILTQFRPIEEEYKGQKNVKFYCYLIDRSVGQVKMAAIPFSIVKTISALQLNEEYAFDDMPMPYDITINAVGAGTKEVKYSVMPARNEIPLTRDEEAMIKDIDEGVKKLKERKGIREESAEVGEVQLEEMPF